MIPILIPLVSVGAFSFNTPISEYLDTFDFTHKDMSGYDVYALENPDISIYVENGVIVSINCYDECIYHGRNIIEMFIEEFMKFYELSPIGDVDELDFEEDNIPQYVYEFDQIGLQVWVKRGKILNVIASGVDDEE